MRQVMDLMVDLEWPLAFFVTALEKVSSQVHLASCSPLSLREA